MKLSLEWLSQYTDVTQDAETLAETLSDLGFPCEGIDRVGEDTVLDVEITSNRGDCLGHIGLARELSVATGQPLRLPEVQLDEADPGVETAFQVMIEEPDLCRRYTARLIRGVRVGPSPDWMRRRLEAVGLRSVNNVVDATNYALMETGQPPHAFDAATLADGRITVRRARPGESLVSINQQRCPLTPEMLVIADGRGPVALAGVMGGLDSEVSERTTDVLLEDAWFDPVSVRTSSRALNLPSDAAFRFERIVDLGRVAWASARTAQLIVEVAGGQVARGLVDVYPRPAETRTVSLRWSRLEKVLGVGVAADRATSYLKALGFETRAEETGVTCAVPSWRSDITREADLIEEVARCHGYDQIPTQQRIAIDVCPVDPRQRRLQRVGRALQACGYYETIGVDFVDAALSRLFGADPEAALAVRDTVRKETNQLRQTLLGTLLAALKTNVNAKVRPCRLYEIANTFVPSSEGLPQEHTWIGLVADDDFRDLRGAVEQAVGALVREAPVTFAPAELAWAETGAEIQVAGQRVGHAGLIAAAVLKHMEIKGVRPVGAELDLDVLVSLTRDDVTVRPIPRFPAIERDLSIVVDEAIRWGDIEATIRAAAPAELEAVRFVEIYRGKGIGPQQQSVTLSLCFRDADGTLQHETVDGYQARIVQSLASEHGAALRA